MSIEILLTMLSSTVVATVISTLFGILQARKHSSLQYITAERQKWREEIREIASEIGIADVKKIGIILNRLKVRINAYGLYDEGGISNDRYVWMAIECVETSKYLNVKFEESKKYLITALSLMLKHDWEVSKKEIRSSIYDWIEKIALILYLFFLGFGIISEGKDNYLLIVCLALFNWYLLYNLYKPYNVYYNNYIYNLEHKINSDLVAQMKDKNSIVCAGLIFTAIILYCWDKKMNITIDAVNKTVIGIIQNLIIFIVPYMVWFDLWLTKTKVSIQKESCYIASVNKFCNKMVEHVSEMRLINENQKNKEV